MRVREVWIHLVDLDVGVSFEDVPVAVLDALIGGCRRVVLGPARLPGGAPRRNRSRRLIPSPSGFSGRRPRTCPKYAVRRARSRPGCSGVIPAPAWLSIREARCPSSGRGSEPASAPTSCGASRSRTPPVTPPSAQPERGSRTGRAASCAPGRVRARRRCCSRFSGTSCWRRNRHGPRRSSTRSTWWASRSATRGRPSAVSPNRTCSPAGARGVGCGGTSRRTRSICSMPGANGSSGSARCRACGTVTGSSCCARFPKSTARSGTCSGAGSRSPGSAS